MLDASELVAMLGSDDDIFGGNFEGAFRSGDRVKRRLSDLEGFFSDERAFNREVADDPLIYSVQTFAPADGPGDLHVGVGRLESGVVGDEYYMTKGHLHERREAAEVYIGLSGQGLMLLEDERDGATRVLVLEPNAVLYVPGHTAHRTINTGKEPLTYLGIYPADAGHDYGVLARKNFDTVVLRGPDGPELVARRDLEPRSA